ncbi:arylesterase [Pollutimonas nitritireducens]|uniref:Arylesterase n=1 Tax=Pollutimonas nitritireducens TaxID=2045209 RepID=A0A2N4UGG8_9BURK|nr:arylesterase [Pollutimonas nitritireducens]
MWIRWRLIIAALCCLSWAGMATAAAVTETPGPSILVVGDSLSAEYGLRRDSGWVALLSRRLSEEKTGYQIHNASISGDTTSGGVSRLPDALAHYHPDIVIIELGSNDALRGLPLTMTQDNLSKMVAMAQEANASVLILGMHIPPNYGRTYAEQFHGLFASVAKQHNAALVPFFMEGIATDETMFQSDGIHPNEKAQALLEKNVWAHLAPILKPN